MTALLPQIASPADLHGSRDAQLEQLAQEMRDELVRVLSIRPAHFASNLGVVELCLALHLTFDFSRDRLIWDTGHQIYPHKLITGRYQQFDTIRTRGGLMGYPNPHESDYDLFMTGHAGCSVSTALGLKVGDDLHAASDDRHSVAVIGDGALPSGIVFEALNNAGGLNKNLLVILNDNEMSICPRVGALARCLDQARLTELLPGLEAAHPRPAGKHSAGRRHGHAGPRAGQGRHEGGLHRRHAVRGDSASATSARSTATTCRRCAAGCATSRTRRARCCCTS